MTYEQIQHLPPDAFKRYCGVHPKTFQVMLSILEATALRKRKPGRPSKLSLANQLLMTLQYWREYWTYFHLAQGWGINESTAYRIIINVETALVQSGRFSLPGKKQLYRSDPALEVVVVDVERQPR